MNPRLSLAAIVVLLVAAAIFLLLRPADVPTSVELPKPVAAPALQRETRAEPADSDSFFILAVSWQPAFCETAPDKPECRSQSPDRFDASHFTLHGLWPQGEYCGVSGALEQTDRDGRWSALPAPKLSPELKRALDTAMPGTRSQLDRHEWIKHGTCFDGDAEAFFAASLHLLEQLNASAARELFAGNTGNRLTQQQIRDAFDASFGVGMGDRVRVACETDGDRTLITELTLGLWGTIDREPDLASLLAAARPTDGRCRSGLVDAVGLQ